MLTRCSSIHIMVLAVLPILAISFPDAGYGRTGASADGVTPYRLRTLRPAIEDLMRTFGADYPHGAAFLRRLDELEAAFARNDPSVRKRLGQLRRDALLASPLLDFDKVLVVKRKSMRYVPSAQDKKIWFSNEAGADLGFPSNHECNSSLPREGYDNEIAVLSLKHPDRDLAALHRPDAEVYVGELDLHWNADRLLFTQSDPTNWKVWEIGVDGAGLRQVSRMPDDVDSFDACYLPNGKIVFGSTASYQAVPCWHGQKLVSNLYVMSADGSGVRQLCCDQDHDFHPCVLPNGQVLYHRWDYTGINHIFMRQLMVMNPDGTGQRAVYGSNSWFPNALYFPQPLPGRSNHLVSILSGYHGVHRMGQLVVLDTNQGWYDADGLVTRISGHGDPIKPLVRDRLVDRDWPKFLHPYPLSDKYFLVACWPSREADWGIYLADVFDNLVLLRQEPGFALFEPIPVKKRPIPPVIPDRIDPTTETGVVYLHDVYAGPGLAGVPRGTAKKLRLLAYHFGYRGLAGPDKIGYGGPWEAMRILGTVALADDGSAMFRVPANTPLAVQPLDAEGKAIQLMRSWLTVMPGERLSCVGCHESPADAAPGKLAQAARQPVQSIEPWYGPARGFDFAREVQPVLNKHCVSCHDGRAGRPDLRPEDLVPDYRGRRLAKLGIDRLHPQMRKDTDGYVKYTPAYDALLPFVRRVGIEDDVNMLVPGEYHADTSPLVQILRAGHQGVTLDSEAWDRIVTWIDLNAPCHGTWGDVYPVPDGAHERRMELRRAFGGPGTDPEWIPATSTYDDAPAAVAALIETVTCSKPSLPSGAEVAAVTWQGGRQRTIDLGEGVTLTLVQIPAGPGVADQPFWMGAFEVTNEQFRRFDPGHDSRYYQKRHARSDDRGLSLNDAQQPAVRVSWEQAVAFCRWLSVRTGMHFALPTEAQWEYACRAGADSSSGLGDADGDFSAWANLADLAFAGRATEQQRLAWEKGRAPQVTGGLEHLAMEGAALADTRCNDGAVVTAPVGSYRPNAWGLCDMHGNAAEWTFSSADADWNSAASRADGPQRVERKVVRGSSFFDPPRHGQSSARVAYPVWQRVFNVGFRVICEDTGATEVAVNLDEKRAVE
ncbi:MAG: SUMF1/EgtB/PvdO family nonheme iron enzyme [Phycisphaerales bacterium]|nr:MAG: SUMF1/EgtB/PvdO family nonheme iron enzyme [Phycisphaerales bacterium]